MSWWEWLLVIALAPVVFVLGCQAIILLSRIPIWVSMTVGGAVLLVLLLAKANMARYDYPTARTDPLQKPLVIRPARDAAADAAAAAAIAMGPAPPPPPVVDSAAQSERERNLEAIRTERKRIAEAEAEAEASIRNSPIFDKRNWQTGPDGKEIYCPEWTANEDCRK